MIGLCFWSHGNPSNIFCFPNPVTNNWTICFCPNISIFRFMYCLMVPFLFRIPSMFIAGIDVSRFSSESLRVFAWFWLINSPPAPLSRRLRVSTLLFSNSIFTGMDKEFLFICPAKTDWIHNSVEGTDVETVLCTKNPDLVHPHRKRFSLPLKFSASVPECRWPILVLSISFPPSWILPSFSCLDSLERDVLLLYS